MAWDKNASKVDAVTKREADGETLGDVVVRPLFANLVDPITGYQNSIIQTGINEFRIQTQGLVESTIVTNPGDQVQAFLRDGGGLRDMNVDGSITPVSFHFHANPLVTDPVIRLTEVRIVMVSDAISFDNTFGKTGGVLPNGCLLAGIVNDGSANTFANLQENTDFLQMVGATPFFDSTTGKAVLEAAYAFGGALTLEPGTADEISITIRDDIAPGPPYAIAQFRAKIFGVEEV